MLLLASARRDFLDDLRYRKRSPLTVSWYAQRLDQLERETGIRTMDQLTRPVLRQFFGGLDGRGNAVESQRNYWRAISGFVHWCRREGYELHPTLWNAEGHFALQQPARDDSQGIEIFTASEVESLRELPLSDRDRLVVELLLGLGLRRRELLWLPADCEMQGNMLHVLGKRNKWRWVPVTIPLQKRIADWRRRRGVQPFSELVYSERTHRPLTEAGLKRIMDRLSERSGLHVNTHKFRHTFATFFLRKNRGEIEQLRQILGHVDYATLKAYLHLAEQDLGKDWEVRAPF